MKCDLNCPYNYTCCRNCRNSKKDYLLKHPELRKYWNEDGFLSENGCKIPRNLMPQECVEYDCKQFVHFIALGWNGSKWQNMLITEVPIDKANDMKYLTKIFNAIRSFDEDSYSDRLACEG